MTPAVGTSGPDAGAGTPEPVDPQPERTARADDEELPAAGSRTREIGLAAALVGTGVLVVVAASRITSEVVARGFGPTWWPTVLGGLLVAGGVAVGVVGAVRPPAVEDHPTAGGLVRLLAVLGLVVGFGAAWYQLHFLLVMPPLLAGLVAVGGGRGLRDLVLVPLLTTAVLYAVFGLLLRVPL
ncbi:tripartite tricarboxylate transporter TctB family protein [Pseudonocardia nematodicida]|uniref:Tripartite tricarboxylate transporter TctB family protein n=1 Tax=Pseudonocardia nematodicida TaxID=1206997 RepID=A0ABV1K930_9PSEU